MNSIEIKDSDIAFDQHFILKQVNWRIDPGQHWVLLGPNGAGKSALAAVLAGSGELVSGSVSDLPGDVAIASFEAQAELIEAERKKDDADLLDVIPEGTPVIELLNQTSSDGDLRRQLIASFNFTPLLDQGFRKLSSGESRKLMLIRALASDSELLILDEPFEGLDKQAHDFLGEALSTVSSEKQIVMVLNRVDEVPDFITHIAYVNDGKLEQVLDRSDGSNLETIQQLLHLKTTDIEIPDAEPDNRAPKLDPSQPLVRIRQGKIAYGHTVIFDDLDWTIEHQQHWQITGPNGSGKTCLLNLITGDHPQCYVNDIFVFGMQRGSGESIWDIKQHLGYVSSALQWEYTVSVSVRNTIISGFYDSIGIYQKFSDAQLEIADQWLALLGMQDRANQPFNQLSFGDQRLVLISRAMVKHPPLLILDEPCLGLDDLNRQLVLTLIEKICRGTETTVLYVNHRSQDSIEGIDSHLEMRLRDS